MKSFFRKFRFWSRLLGAFWRKEKRIIILSCVLGTLSFFLLPKIYTNFFTKPTRSIGLVGKFTPSELPQEVQHLVSDGLTTLAPNGQVEPKIAASWETKNDGKEYVFTLKENIFWQDNTPLKAEDINYNFSDVTTTVIDGKTLSFQLKEPFSPFPDVLARPVFKKGLIGTGEYKIKTLKKNGQFVEKLILVPTKDKKKQTIIFRFYPTEASARTAFKLGEINIIKDLSKPEELSSWKKVKIDPEIKHNRFVAVFFNTKDPMLKEKQPRQALAYAINKRWEPRAVGPMDPRSWVYNNEVKKYDYDLTNAEKLIGKEDNKEIPLKEIELSTVPSLLDVAEGIKSDWEKLGVTTKIKVITSLEDNYQALLVAQEIPSDPDQYILWHSTQDTNISHYASPRVDKLLEDGRKTEDSKKRKEIYLDFQRFLVEDTPVVFLFHPTLYTVSRI